MKMDLTKVPKLVGDDAKLRFKECMSILKNTSWPIYLIGPSGSGKTVMAWNLAKAYAEKNKVPAYYLQLSPDQTKTSIILGLRLVKGSLVAVKGIVSQAMDEGAIIIIDEATHTTQELLLMFNSIIDRVSVTSVGDEIVYAKDTFRTIFCSNNAYYAGNVRLPQSLAQRLVGMKFDYPRFEDEVKIVSKIANDEYNGKQQPPESVVRYICSFVREIRSEMFPLSARNSAIASIRLAVVVEGMPTKNKQDPYFVSGSNVESIRRNIAKRIFGREVTSTSELKGPEITEFIDFVSAVGIGQFKEVVLSSCMFYLDVEGMEINEVATRNKIQSSII